MTVVTLPDSPGPVQMGWQLIDFGGTQQGSLGGAAQRVNRLGNRWRCAVTMPPMTPAQARAWAVALTQGLRLGVAWRLRQVGLDVSSPGTVLVNGAAQAGQSLAVDGMNTGYSWRAGQWLSILTGGRRYLHHVAATGNASPIALEPALRTSPADNSPVELARPMIEGLLEFEGWSIDPDRLARGFTFSITEAR